jgi:nucleotide-binding universal stress UspA family protein
MRILLTTDGSERAARAIPHAGQLASALGADVDLLRVLIPAMDASHVFALDRNSAVEQVREEWTTELNALAGQHGLAATPLVELRAQREETAGTILRVAAERNANLIAMDSRGAGVMRQALLGSVAMGVVRGGCYPVFITGPAIAPLVPRGPYHIVITEDGSPASRDVIRGLKPVFETRAVKVTLLRVQAPQPGAASESSDMDGLADARRGAAGRSRCLIASCSRWGFGAGARRHPARSRDVRGERDCDVDARARRSAAAFRRERGPGGPAAIAAASDPRQMLRVGG